MNDLKKLVLSDLLNENSFSYIYYGNYAFKEEDVNYFLLSLYDLAYDKTKTLIFDFVLISIIGKNKYEIFDEENGGNLITLMLFLKALKDHVNEFENELNSKIKKEINSKIDGYIFKKENNKLEEKSILWKINQDIFKEKILFSEIKNNKSSWKGKSNFHKIYYLMREKFLKISDEKFMINNKKDYEKLNDIWINLSSVAERIILKINLIDFEEIYREVMEEEKAKL